MPELPEVETVRRGLEEMLEGQPTIEQVHLTRGDIRFPIPKNFATALEGAKIIGVRRRAKYLLIDTPQVTLLSHLGMTGSWRIEKEESPHDKHDHCFIELSDKRTLVFRDPRRFRAGIRPGKYAGKLSKLEADKLVRAIQEVLLEAITAGGSSIRDYKNADGESGAFQDSHQVYERGGEPCRKCGKVIRMKTMGGRSTYWCAGCQA
ncbi:MAG: hypothetical protein EOP05_05805 [Proteobacteria bacterium]|nr:MAG: hypothetical protein EOP05_05805 [Pseudomonadota bacterium]